MSKGAKITIAVLFILVLLSLALNGLLLWQWWQFQQQATQTMQTVQPIVQKGLSQAVEDLATFEQSTIQFNVEVNQEFPVQAEVPIRQTLEVPIQTTIPIRQKIQTTVMIDPLQTGFEIPTDVTIPVDMEVPIDLTVPVTIDQSFPLSTTVTLDVTVPVKVDVQETELATYIERLRATLSNLEQAVAGLN